MKLLIKYQEDVLSIVITQEGRGTLKLNEGYLSYLINAIQEKESYPYIGGQFGVERVNGSVILYDLFHGKKRVLVELSYAQADNLAAALSQKFTFILDSYRAETYEKDRFF